MSDVQSTSPEPKPEFKPSVSFFTPQPAPLPGGTAEVIGSPDLFIQERLRDRPGIRVRQIWIDGTQRGYVIAEGSQLGYFELTEGMSREDAIQAMQHAYDKVAVVV